MICQEVERAITDLARGLDVDPAVSAHVRECERCAERLSEQRKLSAALRNWAREAAGEQAPVATEEAVLKVFRRGPVKRRPSRLWIPVAVAASIAAVALLAQWLRPATPIARQTERPAAGPEQVARAAPARVVDAPPAAPRRVKARRVPRATPPPPVHSEVEFIPVAQGDAWTPLDGGRLVRVQLPRSAMRGFGMPVLEDRSFDQVQADVMLSNDGLVRAIRFIP